MLARKGYIEHNNLIHLSIMQDYPLPKKIAGVLVPLFALRGSNDLGVGDTAALLELMEWALEHGFGAIQLLPINETGKSNSPYDALSAFALEPSTITTDPSWIPDLSKEEYDAIISLYDLETLRSGKVHYSSVKNLKRKLLSAAWKKFLKKESPSRLQEYLDFEKDQNYWLPDYTLYRALLEHYHDEENFSKWDPLTREASTAYTWLETLSKKERKHLEERRHFFSYVQWLARSQWEQVAKKAASLGIALIGDVPIGVHIAGADVFSKQELFDTHSFGGAPPEKVFSSDAFTAKWGQNWGIPLYKWEEMSHDNFQWWRHRLRCARSIFRLLRIDHALGLFRIYSFPWAPKRNTEFTKLTPAEAEKITQGILPHFKDYADDTPEHCRHNERRGEMLLQLFLQEVGKEGLLAEDLGETPPYVPSVLSRLKIPGFKLPHWVRDAYGKMLPGDQYPYFSVATYATHDHEPFRKQWEEWQATAQKKGAPALASRKRLRELLHFAERPDLDFAEPYLGEVHQALLKALYATHSWIAIVMITDLFASTQQFNIPGALNHENWTERIIPPIASWSQYYQVILDSSDKALKNCQRFNTNKQVNIITNLVLLILIIHGTL